MTKQEFLDRILKEKPYLGEYQIETESLTDASFVIGCFNDNGVWKVFKTKERTGHYIIDELIDENEAFDELYQLVCMQEKDIASRR
jgi:hypothetical protein